MGIILGLFYEVFLKIFKTNSANIEENNGKLNNHLNNKNSLRVILKLF